MFSRAERVPRELFPEILNRGSSYHSPNLSLKFLPSGGVKVENKGQIGSGFAVVVSRKVSKLAVRRNLWKRRGRVALRNNRTKIKNSGYYVLFLRPPVTKLSFRELENEVANLLQKAK